MMKSPWLILISGVIILGIHPQLLDVEGGGGGAGMYIKKEYDFDIRTDLSKSISNLTETIFI